MANFCLIVIKISLITIIIGAMVIWAILLAQVLQNWPDDKERHLNSSAVESKMITEDNTKVFYITNTCIPELFAIIAVSAVLLDSHYWCNVCGIILAIFWINDHQRYPQLFYYGSPLRVSCHALHLSVWVLLLLYGSVVNMFRIQSTDPKKDKPSRVVNNLNVEPYLRYVDSKYVV